MTDAALNPPQCITEEELTEYLEGSVKPSRKIVVEAHMVSCDRCRGRLAFFIRLLRQSMTEAEAEMVGRVQEVWTRRESGPGLPGRSPSRFRKMKLASGTAVAALALALGARAYLDYRVEPKTAHEVIHLLLAESRPFEPRMSAQLHLPYNMTRGTSDSGIQLDLLAGQMNRLGATAYEMGQFHLLQKDFANAVKYLELAVQEPGATAAVHNDLGIAYMETGDPANLSKAVGEFRRALTVQPGFLPPSFNLALVYERMGRTELAESQWTRYLQLEGEHAWRDEAKVKLEEIRH